MIKLCVFDCDGTIVDSRRSIVAAMAQAFSTWGFAEANEAAVGQVIGLPLEEAISVLLPAADAPICDRVAQSYKDAYADRRRRGAVPEPLYAGASECLKAIEEAGWLLGMATGKSRRGALATLASHGLERRFATLQTSDTAAGKPSPEMMLRAMDEIGAQPETTVMIGDTTYDMMMARNAGTLAVGVAWGYHPKDALARSGAHAVVREFADLLPTVERLLGPAPASGPASGGPGDSR